jgi:hypothetical protein
MLDNSSLRRGIPTAHTVYGVPSTNNAAIFILLICLKKAQDINYPEAMRLCIEQMLKLYQGQGMDVYWRDNYTCPTVEEYPDIAKKSQYRVSNMNRFYVYLGAYNKSNSLYLPALRRFTHAFFALWHSECSEQFQLPWVEILQLLIIVKLLLILRLNWFKHGSVITPNLKAKCLLPCDCQFQETGKYKFGMLPCQIFNTNVIKICQVVGMANYADGETC